MENAGSLQKDDGIFEVKVFIANSQKVHASIWYLKGFLDPYFAVFVCTIVILGLFGNTFTLPLVEFGHEASCSRASSNLSASPIHLGVNRICPGMQTKRDHESSPACHCTVIDVGMKYLAGERLLLVQGLWARDA